ncbi:hypothetical protein DSUL_100147 [Desulfovibrionales bacterium]
MAANAIDCQLIYRLIKVINAYGKRQIMRIEYLYCSYY